jgi:hypothetical protein
MEDQSIYVVDTTHLMVTAEVPAGPVRSYILDEIAGKLAAQQPKRGGKNL